MTMPTMVTATTQKSEARDTSRSRVLTTIEAFEPRRALTLDVGDASPLSSLWSSASCCCKPGIEGWSGLRLPIFLVSRRIARLSLAA